MPTEERGGFKEEVREDVVEVDDASPLLEVLNRLDDREAPVLDPVVAPNVKGVGAPGAPTELTLNEGGIVTGSLSCPMSMVLPGESAPQLPAPMRGVPSPAVEVTGARVGSEGMAGTLGAVAVAPNLKVPLVPNTPPALAAGVAVEEEEEVEVEGVAPKINGVDAGAVEEEEAETGAAAVTEKGPVVLELAGVPVVAAVDDKGFVLVKVNGVGAAGCTEGVDAGAPKTKGDAAVVLVLVLVLPPPPPLAPNVGGACNTFASTAPRGLAAPNVVEVMEPRAVAAGVADDVEALLLAPNEIGALVKALVEVEVEEEVEEAAGGTTELVLN